MDYPKISIITPSYNQGLFIESTIQSVLCQNYPNLEYVIIDGGSTDNSVEIIKKYANRLAYWISEPDKGMYDAIQKGFDKSTGDIMTWINSDDTLSVKSLFTVAEIFSDYDEISWLNGIPNHMDESGRIISAGEIPRWNKYKYLQLNFKYIQQEGIFWRRSLWVKAGKYIDTSLKIAADLELWSRFFSHAELYYISGILGTFRMRSKDQKSLEHLHEYHEEAIGILQNMKATAAERKNIHISNLRLFRLAKKRPFHFLFKLLNYDKAESAITKCPPVLYFNRFNKKFMLPVAEKKP